MFNLKSPYLPTGDQPQAIKKLAASNQQHQVLMGVTGSGKTFTIANVIQKVQKPTLVISHNKTLAAQLYQEFRDYFPDNAVSYFVSYYDYYQPEAYIPQTDTYIEKETSINDAIDKLRLAATTNLLTRKDVIVVASVSCIYNLGSPAEYGKSILELAPDLKISRDQIFLALNDLQYSRSVYDLHRSSYRVRGETIDVYPAYEDIAIRIHHDGQKVTKLEKIDPLTGTTLLPPPKLGGGIKGGGMVIYPAKHYLAAKGNQSEVFKQIRRDLKLQTTHLKSSGKVLEAHRIQQRVTYDLEMIKNLGYVNGIENYSRYFDGRKPGDPPYSLLDYFPKDYLLIVDESHMTIPQIRGMYNGDRSRKQTLIDYGFRLPAALDNRPLKFDEFLRRINQVIYVSATPDEWEISQSGGRVVEQLIRPTGLIDPQISIRPTSGQIQDLESRIKHLISKGQRALVTTLTKRMAEDLSTYLAEQGFKVHYLHSDIKTLERLDILDDLRQGVYDVIVGINLLREGLDLPEVSLVAILDADKEGFLRSKTSLIQTMGRASRHEQGTVIMYADTITRSMQQATDEVSRRRRIQVEYNTRHHITPTSISKPIKDRLVKKEEKKETLDTSKISQLTPSDLSRLIRHMTKQMNSASRDLDFETAARFRDQILKIKNL